MLEKGKISALAIFLIVLNGIGATTVVFLPAVAAKYAGRDAWLTTAIPAILGLIVVLLVTELGRRFPGKTLVEYLQIILGKWPGKIMAIFYLFFFIHTNAFIVRQLGEMITIQVMHNTPVIVINAVMVLLAAYAVRSGLEVIARLFEFLVPWVTIAYFLILLFGLQKAEFHRLLPVLENGLTPVLHGSIIPAAWMGEGIILAMILPYVAQPRKGMVLGAWGIITIAVFMTVDAVVNTAIFGPTTAYLIFPTFTISNEVLVGGFLRIDAFTIILWMSSILTKLSIFYYITALGTAQLFNLKDYRPVVLPLGVILTALSIIAIENSTAIRAYMTSGWPPFAYLFEWVIPLALLVIAIARGFKAGK